jgi:gamma-glutamylcyclotransferase (GGCT)/AIG2-like uncharacterized protein YtfP
MKQLHFLTIAILLLVWGCSKTETSTVNGRVINAGTKKGIEGIKVFLRDGVASNSILGLGGETSSDVESMALTDEEGAFSLTIEGNFGAQLSAAGTDKYLWYTTNRQNSVNGHLISVPEGTTNNVVIEMQAKSYFVVTLQNTQSKTHRDYNSINFYTYDEPVTLAHLINEGSWFGDRVFTITKLVVGDKWLRYKPRFFVDGIENTIIDSVYIPSHDTVRRNIVF